MTYRQACEFLYQLPSWARQGAFHPGLDHIREILRALDDPHLKYPVVHVAGTNGKGSVCAMIAAILTAGGCRVGLHTSPHLFSFTERMRVDGVSASEAWIAETTTEMADLIKRVRATFFEASTAMAFAYFASENVDLAVVEVGMGGRLDATNIVEPKLSVITNIGLDHTEFLGETPAQIAREKAGIIKESVPVLSGCCDEESQEVIREYAARCNAPLTEACEINVDRRLDGLVIDLGGLHQRKNAVLAVEAVDILIRSGASTTDAGSSLKADVATGLANTRKLSGIRGRSEILSRKPLIVADVAHNVEGLEAALAFVRGLDEARTLHVLFGVSKGKNVGGMLDLLMSHQAVLHLAEVSESKMIPASEIAALAEGRGLRIVEIGRPEEIVKRLSETSLPDVSLLATGSHFVVGALANLFARQP